jgi:CrcB protein
LLTRCLLVGIGGFSGSIVRYLVGGWVQQRWGTAFPYGTFLINVTGSFILALFGTLSLRFGWADGWRLFFAVGVLGGYTTFSSFEWESIQLVEQGSRWTTAWINLGGSVIAGFAAAYMGVVTARILMHGRQ